MGAPESFHPDAHPKAKEITGDRQYGEWGQCIASRNKVDERCKGYAKGPHGKCHSHGGSTPTKDEDPNVGKGSENQEGNGRAEKHSLHADRGLFYNRLDEDKQNQVDQFEKALIERYQAYKGRDPDPADVKDLFEISVGYIMRDYAREYMVEQMEESGNPLLEHVEYEQDGEKTEFDKPNELLDKIEGNRKEDRMQRKDKGLEKGEGNDIAEALAGGLELHLSSEDKEVLDQTFNQKPHT